VASDRARPGRGWGVLAETDMNPAMHPLVLLFMGLWACSTPTDNAANAQAVSDEEYSRREGDSTFVTGWYYVSDSSGYERTLEGTTERYLLLPEPIATAGNVASMKIVKSNVDESWLLSMKLDPRSEHLWAQATGSSVGEKFAFILRDELIFMPRVNAEISGGMTALNRGTDTREELEQFKRMIDEDRIHIAPVRYTLLHPRFRK
jgi:hypothetical protein